MRANDCCSASVASRFASACAMRASLWTAAACGIARFWMYPVGSSISWICSESTIRPSFSISVPQAARVCPVSFSRSRIISSTVNPPTMDRR